MMKTATKTTTIELFDFANLIGGHIEFSGSFGEDNYFVNAELHKGYNEARIDHGLSCYGRSDNADLDEALFNLAITLSEEMISFGDQEYNVPELKHTKGYRG